MTGAGQSGGMRHTLWQLWLELYLAPVERVPATIPMHRITGMLEISGLHSEGFDDVSLETEVIEEFAYPQYGAMYDGETDGVWSPTCRRTMPLISTVEH
jgi:hypothetical protein